MPGLSGCVWCFYACGAIYRLQRPGQCVCVARTPPPRGSGREPTGSDGRRARGAEGQRNSALGLLFLRESELGLQEAKSWAWLKLAAHDRRTCYDQ